VGSVLVKSTCGRGWNWHSNLCL